ncbi:hypothetical protein JNK13_11135 [bacterium]|nr:hypothetical protein [bacterium]
MRVSYSIACQYLAASELFIREAILLESNFNNSLIPEEQVRIAEIKHKGLISAVIMQCCAALESSIYQVVHDGPGWHKGSNGINLDQKNYLNKFKDLIDKTQGVVERFKVVLDLLKLEPLDLGKNPNQSVIILVALRNELVHFKPVAVIPFDDEKLLKKLKSLNLNESPFPGAKSIFFPNACLSADCGKWSLESTVNFLNSFYLKLNAGNPIEHYKEMCDTIAG